MAIELGYSDPVAVSEKERAELLAFAEAAIVTAGKEALPYFRTSLEIENKSGTGFDPVTHADRAVEAKLREAIKANYPEHGICGEEYGLEAGNGLTWVIDPIDGTRAFMSGMLHWGCLLGLFNGEEVVVGVMYQPYVDELFSGDCSQAWFTHAGERQQIQSSDCADLDDAVIGTTGVDWFPDTERVQFEKLREATKMLRYGGDCYIYAMVAMGAMDLASDATLKAYDIQGLIPIIRGAGGVVTRYDGGDASLGGTVVCAANENLHKQALAKLAS